MSFGGGVESSPKRLESSLSVKFFSARFFVRTKKKGNLWSDPLNWISAHFFYARTKGKGEESDAMTNDQNATTKEEERRGRGGGEEKTVGIEFVRGKVYSLGNHRGHLQTPERGRRGEFGESV